MEILPYQVFAPGGYLVLQAPEICRSSRRVELVQLAAGYEIRLHGKKIKMRATDEKRRSNQNS